MDDQGDQVRDDGTLETGIRSRVRPPAWTDVWICASGGGHVQATGRDARGRKVYRYHRRYRRERESGKYARLARLGRRLPRIRRSVDRDLHRPGLPRDKVLALVVRLLELTHMRVGNEQYVAANRSFGLTTLRRRHARVSGSEIRFRFRGKSGKEHEMRLHDRHLAALVRRCQELPGQELFSYLDADDVPQHVRSDDVNDYLRRVSGIDLTAKGPPDLGGHGARLSGVSSAGRPWAGAAIQPRQVAAAIDSVASQLGNPAPWHAPATSTLASSTPGDRAPCDRPGGLPRSGGAAHRHRGACGHPSPRTGRRSASPVRWRCRARP